MTRVLTAIVGAGLVLAIVVLLPKWCLGVTAAALAMVSLDELFRLATSRSMDRPDRWALLAGGMVTFSFMLESPWTMQSLAAAILLLAVAAIFSGPVDTALERLAVGIGGAGYTCFLLGFVILLPPDALLVLLGIVWSGDIAAYLTGSMIGRHLLLPSVSPKKTVEGAVGGMIASILAGMLLGQWLLAESAARLVAIALATAVASQLGDLAESALKRSARVKDSSSILPGHGGMLDRMDSLIFAAPVFYGLWVK